MTTRTPDPSFVPRRNFYPSKLNENELTYCLGIGMRFATINDNTAPFFEWFGGLAEDEEFRRLHDLPKEPIGGLPPDWTPKDLAGALVGCWVITRIPNLPDGVGQMADACQLLVHDEIQRTLIKLHQDSQ